MRSRHAAVRMCGVTTSGLAHEAEAVVHGTICHAMAERIGRLVEFVQGQVAIAVITVHADGRIVHLILCL